jgi:hypothetical protein
VTAFAQDRWDLAPAIEPAQPDLAGDHETEEQDERRVGRDNLSLQVACPPDLPFGSKER